MWITDVGSPPHLRRRDSGMIEPTAATIAGLLTAFALTWASPQRPVSEDALAEIRARGTLRWAADAEGGGPFVFPREDNPTELRGFEVELAQLIANRLGVKAECIQGAWDKLPDLLERGDVDIVLNGYEWTPNWSRRCASTIPYYIYELQTLVRRTDSRCQTIDDLVYPSDGRKPRVAVLGGSAAETWLQMRYGDQVELVIFDGNFEAMRAVEFASDGLDATLQDLPIVTHYEQQFPDLRRLGDPVAPGFYVILTRKGNDSLVRELNAAILECWQDGSFPEVLARYGLWNDAQRRRGLLTDSATGEYRLDPPSVAPPGGPEGGTSSSYWDRVPLLLDGAKLTVVLSVLSMPLAIVAGLLIAIGRLYGPRWLGGLLACIVELIRGTPLALQLYLLFFVLPEIGVSLSPMVAAVTGLAINYAAYESEIYRAGLLAIPRGQMEAALCLGMSHSQALSRVIVPQAFRLVLPPVANDFVALFKDTAVCSVITVVELSKAYSIHARSTGAAIPLGLVTAGLYLAMSFPLSRLVSQFEHRHPADRPHD